VKEGRIFGRGVADSKGGPAALFTVLLAMQELDIAPKYNLNIALTTDEEMGLIPASATLPTLASSRLIIS